MAYWTHTENPIGVFVEKEVGNYFEYSKNNDFGEVPIGWADKYPHKVWVGGLANDQGYRYARVLKTRAYICVDEDEYGQPVVEKWYFKSHKEYVEQ